MDFPVFDLHCDTTFALLGEDFCRAGSLRENDLHIDLNRASTLPGYAQCFACFTTADASETSRLFQIDPVQLFEREHATFHRELERNSDRIQQAFNAKDIQENLLKGMMSGILTIEGPAGFDFDPALLEDLYKVGFRITTLSWNEKNPLCGSHVTGGGLTDQGREYVREAQRLGMIVDVSHISDEAFWDIMEITNAPIIASHSNSRSIHNVSRNITDEMFLAICNTGGVTGINLYARFVAESADLDAVCNHIFHFLTLDSLGKHIALGGDLDGAHPLPDGFSGIQDYPKLAEKLIQRGLDEQIVKNIFWNNAVGVIERCCT